MNDQTINLKKQEVAVVAYKGFDNHMQCRGYQFELGKTYKHEGMVEVCKSGFHSCEYPLDVFSYYRPANNRFAVVNASGEIVRDVGGSKIASSTINVGSEIGLMGLVDSAVDCILHNLDTTTTIKQSIEYGDYSAATNTGICSAATNTGICSAATNTGNRSAATNTGNRSAATNTGDYSAATNTGICSAATNTGDYSASEVKGVGSVAASIGAQGRARAALGGSIVLCYRDASESLIHIRASKVGDNGIKPDTWYSLSASGEFVEV